MQRLKKRPDTPLQTLSGVNFQSSVSSSLKVSVLQEELKHYPDQSFVNFLIKSLTEGFHTGINPLPTIPLECKNLLSARQDPDTITQLIDDELNKGYLIGPFEEIPFEIYRINPLGLAQSKYSKKKRLIVDMSAPHNNQDHPSLNELINKEDFSLQYVTIDHAVRIIQSLGKGSWLCKADIMDAFKLIPIHPALWPYHGIKNNNKYYFFTRLVFGSRSSPKIFDYLSSVLCWILRENYGISNILHLLDDFLTIDSPDFEATRTMALVHHVFAKLGIPLSDKKTMGPSTELEYLGIILDTNRMEARLPEEKLVRISQLVQQFSTRKSCTKRELLSLLGHLNFASRVVLPGRSFVSYLISLSTKARELHHYVALNSECRLDLHMWSKFLEGWNGRSFFLDNATTDATDLHLFTDATDTAFGGLFKNQWFQGYFPKELTSEDQSLSMALFELYPIVVASVLWGAQWSGLRIVFNCDNEATVHIINKGRSKIPLIMKFMRKLTLCSAKNNFIILAQHISGVKNCIADALSRFQMDRFRHLAPQADPVPKPCPAYSSLIAI